MYSDREGDVLRELIGGNFLGNASVPLIRRGCLEAVGGFDATWRAQRAEGCEDWDLWLRLAERFAFAAVRDFVVAYRQVRASMSRDVRPMARSYALALEGVARRHPELPRRLFRRSRASFCLYLSAKCGEEGRDGEALRWLLSAFASDRSLLRDRNLRGAARHYAGRALRPARRSSSTPPDDQSIEAPPPVTLDDLRAKVR